MLAIVASEVGAEKYSIIHKQYIMFGKKKKNGYMANDLTITCFASPISTYGSGPKHNQANKGNFYYTFGTISDNLF